MKLKKHVLILGCGRSGTSIFGEFFQDIGSFTYFSEIDMDEIMDLEVNGPIAIKVPRPTKKYPADHGLSFPLQTLLKKLENNVQIFWIIRHPLDTICSLKIGIEKNWGHHPRPNDWKEWLDQPLLKRCAHHWNYINTYGYQRVSQTAKTVYFEDLVGNPSAFVKEIGNFVQIEHAENDLSVSKWINRVQNENNSKFIEAETSKEYSRDDHQQRIGRWKENLNIVDARELWKQVSETSKRMGYLETF